MTWEIRQGNALELLRAMAGESIQACVCSPPYWGLRSYGTEPQVWGGDPGHSHVWRPEGRHRGGPAREDHSGNTRGKTRGGQAGAAACRTRGASAGDTCACGAWLGELGLEPTVDLYVAHVLELFREVRRVLKRNGTLWLNLGDSYIADRRGSAAPETSTLSHPTRHLEVSGAPITKRSDGLKPKDLVGIPWRVAFALQADGWFVRSDIVWAKPNPMPESVRDRPTKAHEYVFLMSKSERYYYDYEATLEPVTGRSHHRCRGVNPKAAGKQDGHGRRQAGFNERYFGVKQNASFAAAVTELVEERNRRSVWTIPTEPYPDAHFATFPQALVQPCILAGSRVGDTVLDPCAGSGTVGVVALRHGRHFLGLELSPAYVAMARRRIGGPLFAKAVGA